MNITIDTEKKELILNEDINIEDFIIFYEKNPVITEDYIIKKKVKTIHDFGINYPLDGSFFYTDYTGTHYHINY